MSTVGVALVVGVVSGALTWALTRDVFSHPSLARRNVRGLDVPTAGGAVLLLALLPGWVATNVLTVRWQFDVVSFELASAFGVVGPVAIFAFLGLVDDVLAQGAERGFRGHLGALATGRLTTGGVKLVGGGLAALAIAAQPELWRWLLDAAVIALAANLANLLDRAPGRLTKVSVLVVAVLAVIAPAGEEWRVGSAALVVGVALGMVVPELREQIMLGDTGANPLGAVLGLSSVLLLGTTGTVVVAVALLGLNLLSERVSFSDVIDRTPALRWLDRLGRPTG